LFISHSSKDNIEALAFQRWLMANGWSEDDVFIDLYGVGVGELWRQTLVKANVACGALLYLASPESLESEECKREVRRAEDDKKEVIVAILRDVKLGDPRLDRYADRQLVDLSSGPREVQVEVEHQGVKRAIEFNGRALNAIHAKLIQLGIAPESFIWPPKDQPNAAPYPGLDAFDERSAGIFFGREAAIMTGIRELRQIRHRGSPRLLIIQAASGAGKSSFLRAGLWPRLERTAEFVPLCVLRPAKGILTGQHGLGVGLAAWFTQHKRARSAGSIHSKLAQGDEAAGATKLSEFLSEAVALLAHERASDVTDDKSLVHPSPLIAIDQGDELFAPEDVGESTRFLGMLGKMLSSPPAGLDAYVLITIGADTVDTLLQNVPKLGIDTPHIIALPPLSPASYRDVITKPAAVYTRQVGRLDIEPELIQTMIADAIGADALPLLAFTLQRLFKDFSPEKRLLLTHYQEIGGTGGSIDRALRKAQADAGVAGTDDKLRRLVVPALATWVPTAGAAKRLIANEADLIGGDRTTLKPLADALVANRLLTRGVGTLEVAHEALLRRAPLAGWLEEQKGALNLRDDVLKEAKEWRQGGRQVGDLVRRGERLKSALDLSHNSDFADVLAAANEYLVECQRVEREAAEKERQRLVEMADALDREKQAQGEREKAIEREKVALRRGQRALAAASVLFAGIVGGAIFVYYRDYLMSQWFWLRYMNGHGLTTEQMQTLKPKQSFRECAQSLGANAEAPRFSEYSIYCPEMVVVPAGTSLVGSPSDRGDSKEHPQHEVTIARPFAVSRFEVTAEQWQTCVSYGGCPPGGGTGKEPVSGIRWYDAKHYVRWLSNFTGQTYRLLSNAEWEYATRARTAPAYTEYSWGNELGKGNANCAACGSTWDGKSVAPVGSFKPNDFGLFDMHGNVWEWVEDTWHDTYDGAPTDGSAWLEGPDPRRRVIRGGAWYGDPIGVRAARRGRYTADDRGDDIGFRIARRLGP
jgi:formylglycine-generating enzyme required for sulfatase activity